MTTAEEIKGQFEENVDKYDGFTEFGIGMKGAITGVLESACKNKENRKLVLKQLSGQTSSKNLHPAQWDALHKLVRPWKPEGGHWQSENPDLERICNILLNKAVDQPGQDKFDFPEFKALDEDKLWIDQINSTDSLDENPF